MVELEIMWEKKGKRGFDSQIETRSLQQTIQELEQIFK